MSRQEDVMGKAKSTNNKTNRGRRFTPEQRAHALALVRAEMKRTEIARVIGTTQESIRRWVNAAAQDGAVVGGGGGEQTQSDETADVAAATASASAATSPYKPRDPGQGLADYEVEAIVELKREHPSYGPAQLRAQLKRFKGWRLSNKAIARVLKQHGYELVHVKGRPQGPEPIRFEAPRRNALWQMDFATMRVGGDKLQMLVIIDDFSRYVVGHTLGDDSDGNVVIEVLELTIARHGKPEGVRTDRGGVFTGGQVGKWLEAELIDHSIGRSYHPQGGGKVESLIGTIRRELWDVEHFADRRQAQRRLATFIDDFNHHRAHMGIDGLTPADRYFGRADLVLARIDALSRKRQGALQQCSTNTDPIEEITSQDAGSPMEVLRLIIIDGQMEVRLCGARVVLGRVQNQ